MGFLRTITSIFVLLVAATGIGFWRGNVHGAESVQGQFDAYRSQQAKIAMQQAHDAASSAAAASAKYQEEIAHARTQTRTIRQTVVRTVPATACLDAAGLRNVNLAIAGSAASATR